MTRTYAIGDIHGHLDKLREVHGWIERDRDDADDVVVHVGDLTDRGPDSAGVIRFLIAGLKAGKPWVVLKGNHDRMMSLYLGEPSLPDPGLRSDLSWQHVRLGGLTTLASYGVDVANLADDALHSAARAAVPREHRAFLAGLDTVYRTKEVLFVHAGIRPGVAIEDQVEDDLDQVGVDPLNGHLAQAVQGGGGVHHLMRHQTGQVGRLTVAELVFEHRADE